MTNLTEKWKKGELESGWYWVKYYAIGSGMMAKYLPNHIGFGYDEKKFSSRSPCSCAKL